MNVYFFASYNFEYVGTVNLYWKLNTNVEAFSIAILLGFFVDNGNIAKFFNEGTYLRLLAGVDN
jgi:hypothetical protein